MAVKSGSLGWAIQMAKWGYTRNTEFWCGKFLENVHFEDHAGNWSLTCNTDHRRVFVSVVSG
jgi:hypothetical protein